MMRSIIAILAITLVFAYCSKSQDSTLGDGHYSGTFRRISNGQGDTAYVNLTIAGNSFEGTNGPNNYPSICKGTYSANGQEVDFKNQCFFTANFDWSLILSGKYEYRTPGDSLIIIRDYNGIFRDEYRLVRGK